MALSERIDPLYTCEEIRQLLHYKTLHSVYRLLRREGIGHKIGGQIYVKEGELQNLINRHPLASESEL